MRRSFRRRIGACFFMLACSVPCAGSAARAASLEAFAGTIAGVSSCETFMTAPPIANFFGGGQGFIVGTTGNGISDCGLQGGFQDVTQATGPLTSPLESLTAVPVSGGNFTGSASGTANYGSMGASANGQFTGTTGPLVLTSAASFGIFDDLLTITSPNHATGSLGDVQFTFTIQGSIATPGSNPTFATSADALLALHVGSGASMTSQNIFHATVFPTSASVPACSGNLAGLTVQAGLISGNARCSTGPLAFEYGVPFEIAAGLLVQALPDTGGNATGSMTAALTGINISGETNFGASGSSGTSYPVPEPSTVMLLTGGLAALWLRRRAA
ncbi:MAG TPA: PEP-CTERM sorting domain-containing protein [Myxococcota bacterium]|nr:PEP-CTERM sorting domain-containing protein [Myxococcota bacterium]